MLALSNKYTPAAYPVHSDNRLEMAESRKVKIGECLSSLAQQAGLGSWKDIYDRPENETLRRRARNPNILPPGDEVYIPDIAQRFEKRPTEQRHRFRARREKLRLRIRILDEHWAPLSNCSYTLRLGLDERTGSLDRDGFLDEPVPADARAATLEIDLGNGTDTSVWTLELRALAPPDTRKGVTQRLSNLGFAVADGDAADDARQQAELRRFQKMHELAETGRLDAHLMNRVREEYGA